MHVPRILITVCLSLAALSGCSQSPPPIGADSSSSETPTTNDEMLVVELGNDPAIAELDPTTGEWATEAITNQANVQLKRLSDWFKHPDKGELEKLLSNDFRCGKLRPKNLIEISPERHYLVRQSDANDSDSVTTHSPEQFADAFQSLPGSGSASKYLKCKIIGVNQQPNATWTTVFVEGNAQHENENQRYQWNAVWDCRWQDADSALRLAELHVTEYVEVETSNGIWFRDATAQVVSSDAAFRDQLAYGMDHWLQHLEGRLGVTRLGHNGLAIGDVNNDGRDDIYVCQTGGLPNRLYVQNANGTATEASASAGVDILDDTTCALLVDLDNDGDSDLVLATISGGGIYTNDGTGKFAAANYLAECRNAFSLTAADYDQDGMLDIYVGRYWPTAENRGEIPIPVPYYDGRNGGANVLLRNTGEFQFADVTTDVGLSDENSRYTMAAAWEDLDDDGDQDLYVANDFGKNAFYRNDDGKFTNVAAEKGVEDIASGMSVTFSDVDHDGRSDIYVSNMFSSAGNRITYQRQFEERFQERGTSELQRMARGNSLFRQRKDGNFSDISAASGTTMGRWSWGSLFADINNDSWDDLVIANGNITSQFDDDL